MQEKYKKLIVILLLLAGCSDPGTYEADKAGLLPLKEVACPANPPPTFGYIEIYYIKSRHDMPKFCSNNPEGQDRGCIKSIKNKSYKIYALDGDFKALAHELDHLICGTSKHI